MRRYQPMHRSMGTRTCWVCGGRVARTDYVSCSRACYFEGVRRNALSRFWARVDKRSEAECWEWTGGRDRYGYGRTRVGVTAGYGAHRQSYALVHGPIPEGMNVLHRCDNPPCVNPGHLFLGTQADNLHDMEAKGRAAPHPTKLSDEDVAHLRLLGLGSGLPHAAIAARFGVSRRLVGMILAGQRRAA